MEISGTHRGRSVTVKVESSSITEMRQGAERTLAKAESKGKSKIAARFRAQVAEWVRIEADPGLLAQNEDLKKQYIDHVLFDEQGFAAQF